MVCEGVELLKQFKEDVERFEVQRQELSNAEQLFDLPITVYPELIQVQKELKGQEQIYTIYEEQKVLLCCCELIFLMYLANQLCKSRKHSDGLNSAIAHNKSFRK